MAWLGTWVSQESTRVVVGVVVVDTPKSIVCIDAGFALTMDACSSGHFNIATIRVGHAVLPRKVKRDRKTGLGGTALFRMP